MIPIFFVGRVSIPDEILKFQKTFRDGYRSDIDGGPEQLFKIIANLKIVFRFYCACPDQEPYFNKIINESVPVSNQPHRKIKIKNLPAGHANSLLLSYY
jgi:hypothetical protein